jgi:sugar lactone lactonase YvrE
MSQEHTGCGPGAHSSRLLHRAWRPKRTRAKVVTAVLAGFGALAASATAAPSRAAVKPATPSQSHAPTVTVIASGLNNPRGLAFDEDGHLWVAEAGRGGTQCLATPGEPTNPTCFGSTGALSRIVGGQVHRVYRGLPSRAAKDGSEALGPDGLAIFEDSIYTVEGESDFAIPQGLGPGLSVRFFAQAGRLLRGNADRDDEEDASRALTTVADPGDFDFAWTNQHKSIQVQYPDANPHGILVLPHQIYLVDAAANTLDSIDQDGTVHILAVFPDPPVSDAVPTCIDRGPDGALYIGQLTGVGNGPTAANVYRWTAQQGLKVWQSGFSAITGCGFGSDGSFYVTEFDTVGFPPTGPSGDVVRIAHNGTRTVLGSGQLFFPNGFAAGKDGSIYVSNWSILPGTSSGGPTGEVVRIG